MADFGARILSDYPLPIARAYRRLLDSADEAERFDRALQLGEIVLKYAAIVGIGSYLADEAQHEALDRSLANLTRPSLGQWRQFLDQLTKLRRGRPWLTPDRYDQGEGRPGRAAAVRAMRELSNRPAPDRARPLSCRDLLVELIEFRNWLAHGAPGPERRAAAVHLQQAFEELLADWGFLASADLLSLTSRRHEEPADSGRAIRYMGETPGTLPAVPAASARVVDAHPRLYVVPLQGGCAGFTVHPLLVLRPPFEEPLFVHGRHGRTWEMLDHSTGHVQRESRLSDDFHERLGERVDLGGRLPRHNLVYSPNRDFVGREQDLDRLHELLTESPMARVAVSGIGGRGKTQLAVQYSWENASAYPGGVFWVSAESREQVRMGLADLSEHFEIPSELPLDERFKQVWGALERERRPVLVVFDNVLSAPEIAALLPPATVLITTRRRHLALADLKEHPLAALTKEAGLRLLNVKRSSGPQPHSEPKPDPEAETALCEALGFSPLALSLAGHHMRRLKASARGYLAGLRSGSPLEVLERAGREFSSPTEHSVSVVDTLLLSYESLSDVAQRLLHAMACLHPHDLPADMLAASGEWTRLDFRECLAELVDASLADWTGEGRLSLHNLVHQFARDRCSGPERLQHLRALARALTDRLQDDLDRRNIHLTRVDLPHCLALARQAAGLRGGQDACRLWCCLGECLSTEGQLSAATRWLARALRRARLEHGRDDPRVAQCQSQLGVALFRAGRSETARRLCLEALSTVRKCAEVEGRLLRDVLMRLGQVQALRVPAEAVGHFAEALELCRHLTGDDSPETAACWNDLGYAHRVNGDLPRALECYQHALGIGECLHGRAHPTTATRLSNIGMLFTAMGDPDGAEEYVREALEIETALLGGDHPKIATRLVNLAHIQLGKGKAAEAEKHLKVALEAELTRFAPNHRNVGLIRRRLGDAYAQLGDSQRAIPQLEVAARIIAEDFGEDTTYWRMAVALLEQCQGDQYATEAYAEKAREHYDRARSLLQIELERRVNRHSERHSSAGLIHRRLADIHQKAGDLSVAATHYRQAREIYAADFGASSVYTRAVDGKLEECRGDLAAQEGDGRVAGKHYQVAFGVLSKLFGAEHLYAREVQGKLNTCGGSDGGRQPKPSKDKERT